VRLLKLIALLLCLWSASAMAQGARTLTLLTARESAPGEVTVALDFDRSAPEARIAGNDTDRITVTLRATSRGQAARFDGAEASLVRNIAFQQEANALQLTFFLSGRAHMEMTSDSQRRFVVKLNALDRSPAAAGPSEAGEAEALASAAAGPLPRALDPPPGEDGYALIPLKYADVSEVVGLLTQGVTVRSNGLFSPREPGFGSPGTNSNSVQNPQNQAAPDDRPLGQAVDSNLAIDRRLNAIWVRGSPDYIARIRAMIAVIDIPLTSVLIETEFVELTETGARAIGLDFANAAGQLATATAQSGQFIPFANLTNGTTGRLDSFSIQAALYAQIEKGEGRIISKPKIAAQSGSTAKIITGDALPILTAITLSGVNGVSEQVQYVNVGVTLQIAPRVSSDGFVSSNVFAVVSSVTGYSQGYPTISQRQAETSATVRDGESFVIGGLVQDSELKSTSRIPLLGDIPILGRIFRTERRTRSKTELYIVITPRIVRSNSGEEGGGAGP
jgi:general secretion pathway protein D